MTYFPGSRLSSQFPDSDRHSPSLAPGFCGQIPGKGLVLALAGEISAPVLLCPHSCLSFLLCLPPPAPVGLTSGWNTLLPQMPSSPWFLQLHIWLLFSSHLASFKCVPSYPEGAYDFLPLLKFNQILPVSQLFVPTVIHSTRCQLQSSRSILSLLLLCTDCRLALTCLLMPYVLKASLWVYQE